MSNQKRSARRASRHKPKVKRERDSSFWRKLLIMLAIVVAIILGVAIFFRVRTIEVQGNRIYSAEQVAEISGVEPGDNLLTVNRNAISGNIQARLPYVQFSSVGILLPDTVIIKVEESEVAGLVQSDVGTAWYLNTRGRVLGSSMDGFSGQVVELTGFTVTAPKIGQQAVPSEEMEESLEAALSVLKSMEGTGLMNKVTAIDSQKPFDLVLRCGEQYEIRLGGTDELDYKIWYLQEVLDTLDPYQTGTIDLTLSEERKARFYPWAEEE